MNEEVIYKKIRSSDEEINLTVELLRKCFPESTKFSYEYLKWLYFSNPEGDVVGFNAYSNGELVGHYSCIPMSAVLSKEKAIGLLSLNTATDPKFQGRGLFKKLANKTYDLARDLDYSFVCGVANSRSTRLFTKLLRFDLVGSLDVKIGFGDYFKMTTPDRIANDCDFYTIWNEETLYWRMSNPYNKSHVTSKNNVLMKFSSPTQYKFIINSGCCYSKSDVEITESRNRFFDILKLRLVLALTPNNANSTYVTLPDIMKPSPLNLIFKNLNGQKTSLQKERVFFNYMDFDAY